MRHHDPEDFQGYDDWATRCPDPDPLPEDFMTEDVQVIEPAPAPPTNPLQILAAAAQRGATAAELNALTDWVDRVRRMDAEDQYNRALQAAQEEMPVVVRSKANTHTKVAYAPLDDVNARCKPVLAKHGLSLSFSDGDTLTAGMKRTVCEVRHIAGHVVRHFIDLPYDGTGAKGNANMNAVQGAISTGTYAQRVLICRIFNVTIADTDTDGASLADFIKITPEQRTEMELILAQRQANVPVVMAWLHNKDRDKLTPEELTLDSVSAKQFQQFVIKFKEKYGK